MDNNNTLDHASRDHATYSPSGMKLRAICPSFRQEEREDNEAAELGTAAHEAVEARDASLAPEGYHKAVEKAIDILSELEAEYPNMVISIEEKVETHEDDCWGTVDVLGYDSKQRLLYLLDWKFGKLAVDDASSNIQLGTYAVGAWRKHPDAERCLVRLVNPMRGDDTVHLFNLEGKADLERRISSIIGEVRENSGVVHNPGDACGYCGEKPTCPAIKESLLTPLVSEAVTLPDEMDASLMTEDDLAKALEAEKIVSKMVLSWAKAIRAEALTRIENGAEVPGYTKASKKARLSITDAKLAVDIARDHGVEADVLEEAVNVDVSKLRKAIYSAAPQKEKKKTEDSFVRLLVSEGAASQLSYDYLRKKTAKK